MPVYIIMALSGFWISLPFLQPYLPQNFLDYLDSGFGAVIILVIGLVVYKSFDIGVKLYSQTVMRKTQTEVDDFIFPIIGKFGKIAIVIFTLLAFFNSLNYDITAPLAGLGIAGLALAFAARDTIENFLAGLFLMFDRPFVKDDYIEFWTRFGVRTYRVVNIGVRRSTLYDIETYNYVIVSNKDLASAQVMNWNLPDAGQRISIPVNVAADMDIDLVEKLLLEVASDCEYVEKEPSPEIHRKGISASAVNLELVVYIDDYRKRLLAKDKIYYSIRKVFKEKGVKLA